LPWIGQVEELIEYLDYFPAIQDTGDLEAATKTITATAEASGLGAADYNKALTLAKPPDARIIIKRVITRLAVTIDTITAPSTTLYCRVYVDAQDADHKLFDLNWNTTGNKLSVSELGSGTIFDLLTDGAAHTFYFYFWVDANATGGITISVVQLWEGVGSATTQEILRVEHEGFLWFNYNSQRIGTGTGRIVTRILKGDGTIAGWGGEINRVNIPNIPANGTQLVLTKKGISFFADSTVATDLPAVIELYLILRGER